MTSEIMISLHLQTHANKHPIYTIYNTVSRISQAFLLRNMKRKYS